MDNTKQLEKARAAKTGTKPKNPLEKWKDNKLSLRLSINAFCFACVGELRKEVTNCTAKNCPLWLVRPYQKGDEE